MQVDDSKKKTKGVYLPVSVFYKAVRQNFESVTHAKYFELDILIGLIRFSREVLDHALGTKIGF